MAGHAPIPPPKFLEAAQSYMLGAHVCADGPVIYSWGTGDDSTIGIKAIPVDRMPPATEDIHPYDRATTVLQRSAPIPLWGFGMSYCGHVAFVPTGVSDSMAVVIDPGRTEPDNPRLELQRMCAAVLFVHSADRHDLIRPAGKSEPTAITFRGTDNPYPPPGEMRHLWIAAVALDRTNIERFAALDHGHGTTRPPIQ
ncbi:hypothetical protein [Nocardia sp. BMG51109]|uniref:hypothetical protein n=1 Tax=Nocardia sp. BMG51109 TaxID=1056816 RepID=UPI000464015C|nr:hypothetical protein [Nocardia sp. BMG51109]